MCYAKRLCVLILPAVILIAASVLIPGAIRADVVFLGDVSPNNPASWNSSTDGYIGYTAGAGTATVANASTLVCYKGYIGYSSSGTGTVTVDGVGSTWRSMSYLYVGGNSTGTRGTLCVQNGGSLVTDSSSTYIGYATDSAGTMTITNEATWYARDITVGRSGAGMLEILGGGSVTLASDCKICDKSSSSGTVNIDGPGSILSIPSGYFRIENAGALNITNGGVLASDGLSAIGYVGDSATATINGAGSTWTNNGCIMVGHGGVAAMSIINGGAVGCQYVGVGEAGYGTLNVINGGNVNADLYVGKFTGHGRLHIDNGITSVAGATYVAYGLGSVGTVTFGANSGTLTTKSLYMSSCNAVTTLAGAGTIVANGLVGDFDLSFDSSHGTSQTFTIEDTANGGTATVQLDMHDSNNVGDLGAGYRCDFIGGAGGGIGTLTIKDSVVVHSARGYLGFQDNASGTATVDGAGSEWRTSDDLYVGYDGHGTLNITNGALVHVGGDTYLGYTVGGGLATGATGLINLNGGTLSTNGLWAGEDELTGTGSVIIHGWVTDADLVFDASHGESQLTTFNNGNIDVTLDMSSSTGNGDLGVGCLAEGTLLIADGRKIYSATGYLGYKVAEASGTATVTGNGSEWNNSEDLYVGYYGTGELNILGGGAVTNVNGYIGYRATTGNGVVTVDGTDGPSTWTNSANLYVGYDWGGTLYVRNGGTVSNVNAYLGYNAGWTARATVTGSASRWISTGDLYVGNDGKGSLTISGDGVVDVAGTTYLATSAETSAGTIAFGAGGGTLSTGGLYLIPNKYQITGNGTIAAHGVVGDINLVFDGSNHITTTLSSATLDLDMSDPAKAGSLGIINASGGNSTLVIRNGTTVYSTTGYVGYGDSVSGTATVSGATWSVDDLVYVGGHYDFSASAGSGVLNIENGGVVSAGGIRKGTMGTGTVYLDNGTLQAKADTTSFMSGLSNVYVKTGGVIIDSNGHDITVGQQLLTDPVSTGGGLTKTGNGKLTLSGSNTYTGLTVVEAGTLELGSSAQSRVLTAGGADIQGGKLVFTHTGGTATGGQIWDILDDSFGTSFTAGQIFSSTAQANGMALGWADDGSETTVMYTLYGDSNLDGSVNGTDLNAVLSYYNQSIDLVWGSQIWMHGDFNYDGSVNGTDLNTVLSNYNQSLPASTAAVPEPSTLLLMVLGLIGLLAWRKRFEIC